MDLCQGNPDGLELIFDNLRRNVMPSPIARTNPHQSFEQMKLISKEMNEKNDCSVIAVALSTDSRYEDVHDTFTVLGRRARKGCSPIIIRKAVEKHGHIVRSWGWKRMREMIESYPHPHDALKNITTHHMRRFPESWSDVSNVIMLTRSHCLCVKDGVNLDWSINNALRASDIWDIIKAE